MAKGKRVKKGQKNVKKTAIIAVAAIAVLAVVLVIGTGVYASGLSTVYPNVSVSGIELGGMTFNEAHRALLNSDFALRGEMSVTVALTEDTSLTLTGTDVGYAENITDVANMAVSYGKDGGFFSNMVKFLKCVFSDTELAAAGSFNEDVVRERISEAAQAVNHDASDKEYTIGEKEITIVKGTSGYEVDEEGVFEYISTVFAENTSGKFETEEFSEKNSAAKDDGGMDFDALYDEVYVEPANAVYDPETGMTSEAVTGVSFDVAAAKLKYAALGAGEKMTIELIFTEPDITAVEMESMVFRDCLAEKSTSLSTSSANRITNVTLAAAAINGTVLQPGDEFSFNKVVGERTAAKGYQPAGAYVGGETVDQIGGGICQVSSTIYYCVLMANLEVTARTNHMFSVAYLPLGFDATVNWGTIDFKFKNNQDYPVKIVSYVENKQLYVELWGTKLDDSYVELKYELIEVIGFETVEQEDESLAPGETKTKTTGHNGYIADTYQYVYDGNGNLIAKNYLARNKYNSLNTVILVAPKTEEVVTPGEPTQPGGETTPPTGTTDPGGSSTTTNPPETGGETTTTPEPSGPEETGGSAETIADPVPETDDDGGEELPPEA